MDAGTKVTIVGAGLSGLFCGYILNRMGFDVEIYEATDRVGGRVHSIKRRDKWIEAGGEYIGSNHEIWLYLARHFNLKLNPIEFNPYYEKIKDVCMKFSEDASIITFPDEPWNESSEIRALDNVSVKDRLDLLKIDEDVRETFENYLTNENVSPLDKQSYLGLLCQIKAGSNDGKNYWTDTEKFTCDIGCQSLAKVLSKSLNVIKSFPITKIKYEDDKIRCNNSIESDFVVISVPPSVWKNIEFDDTLDLSKYTPDMGPAVKIINHFEEIETLFAGGPNVNLALNEMFSSYLHEHEAFVWNKIPYIKTGYSYAGVDKVITVNKLLYNPVPEYGNRLIFAGEHTSVGFCGFMEGALQSGLRAALQIIKRV
jgi:monoamine oxidase